MTEQILIQLPNRPNHRRRIAVLRRRLEVPFQQFRVGGDE
jgi:hypothetical protein